MRIDMFVFSFAVLIAPPTADGLVSHYGTFKQAFTFSGIIIVAEEFEIPPVNYIADNGMLGKIQR